MSQPWKLSTQIEPNFDGGVLRARFLQGGVRVVKSKAQRNALPALYRSLAVDETTIMFVESESALYKLINNPAGVTTDTDWERINISGVSSFKPVGTWNSDNTTPVLQDTDAVARNGEFYFVIDTPTLETVTIPGLFAGLPTTVVDGNLITSVGDQWVVVANNSTWDSIPKPSVIDDYVDGIVIPHTHVAADITDLGTLLDAKYDVGDTADHTIPFGSVPDTAIIELEFLKQWYYTKDEVETLIGLGGGGGVTQFIQLIDAPSSYTGEAGNIVTVNGTEDGLIFTTPTPPLTPVDGSGLTWDTDHYNITGTLTEDMSIDGDGNGVYFTNLGAFNVDSTGGVSFSAASVDIGTSSGDININSGNDLYLGTASLIYMTGLNQDDTFGQILVKDPATDVLYWRDVATITSTPTLPSGNGLTWNTDRLDWEGTLTKDVDIQGDEDWGFSMFQLSYFSINVLNGNILIDVDDGGTATYTSNGNALFESDGIATIHGNAEVIVNSDQNLTLHFGSDLFIEGPVGAGGSNDVLTIDPTTGLIGKVTQASLSGGGSTPSLQDVLDESSSATITTSFSVATSSYMEFLADGDIIFNTTSTYIQVTTSGSGGAGIIYAADYSANFTDRSVVDKGYVDTAVSSITIPTITAGANELLKYSSGDAVASGVFTSSAGVLTSSTTGVSFTGSSGYGFVASPSGGELIAINWAVGTGLAGSQRSFTSAGSATNISYEVFSKGNAQVKLGSNGSQLLWDGNTLSIGNDSGVSRTIQPDSSGSDSDLVINAKGTGKIKTTFDLAFDTATKGIILKDTQGTPHYWRITVNNSGVLVTTDIGTSI